jgi:chromosome segregation ATPase
MLFYGDVLKRICFATICLGLLLVNGCRGSWLSTPTKVDSTPSPAVMDQYRQAIAAFQKKEYLTAITAFEAIRTQTRDKRFAVMALYGLANAKLMAAKTPDEYNNALLLWQNWIENAPAKFDYENPTMVDALIQEKMLFSNIPLSTEQSKETTQEPMVSRWLFVESKLELDRVRSELSIARKALEKRQKKIRKREMEIGELKRQIKALETIDQKIQKKKNAIPSAD